MATTAGHDPYKTWGDNLWDKFDDMDENMDIWADDEEEDAAFVQRVHDDIEQRRGKRQRSRVSTVQPAPISTGPQIATSNSPLFDTTAPSVSSPTRPRRSASNRSSPNRSPARRNTASAPISSRRSNSAATPSRPIAAPSLPFNLVPSVSTPSMRQPLPAPPPPQTSSAAQVSTRNFTPSTYDTPVNVPTPAETPGGDSVARGRRDDPATPVPLGSGTFANVKGQQLQRLTKNFDMFTKDFKMPEGVGRGKAATRGRNRAAVTPSILGLGGNVFKGLRFCIPPDKAASKSAERWKIIAKLGGEVVLRPDTAITHVIYDGTSAATLARELGLESLSELPEGTVCVKWLWVTQCQISGKLLDPAQWPSFPKTSLTRSTSTGFGAAPRRMADITHQLRAASGIRTKRAYTPSDSETESSERPPPFIRRMPTHVVSDPLSSPATPYKDPFAGAATRHDLPDRRGHDHNPNPNGTVATRHDQPSGRGWVQTEGSNQDGLDILINGIMDGTIKDADSEKEVSESEDEAPNNPNPMADRFQCGKKSTGAKKGPNEWLAVEFEKMFNLYEGDPSKNDFSKRGYQKAAGILRNTTYPITSGKQAMTLKGIGGALAMRIDEFIQGSKGRAYYEDTEKARAIAVFKNIYGVGKGHANELYRRGARSIEDLRTHEYGLTSGQKIGVDLYEDLIARIPREECRTIYETIRDAAHAIDPTIWLEIMGSYRRGQETSGDVDILITRDDSDGSTHQGLLKKLISTLNKQGFITHHLTTPTEWHALEAKWMGVVRLPGGLYRRVDILTIPFVNWGAALLYFTGNEVFNRSLRLYARKKGFSLNQRGLYKEVIRDKQGNKTTEGTIVASRTEQEIFDYLGVRWRDPRHRRP